MHVELTPVRYSLRIYGNHPENPRARAQISNYGEIGWLSEIQGKEFWQAGNLIAEECLKQGIKTLSGYLRESHARLLSPILKKQGFSFIIGPSQYDGVYKRNLCWCTWYLEKE